MAVTRTQLTRFGAPVAFLLAVTIAVLLVRAGLNNGAAPAHTSTLGPVTSITKTAVQAPAKAARTRTRPAAAYFTVRKGDSFGSIAARSGTSVAALERLNPGVSSTALQVGERIRVK